MLPAYFATSFRRRRALVSMTFVFALGVATVILPIAFGASAVTRFILGHHLWVFLVGAVLMVGLGLATIAGWKLPLPAPSMAVRREKSSWRGLRPGCLLGDGHPPAARRSSPAW